MASLTVNVAGLWTSTINVAAGGAVASGLTQDGWNINLLLHEQVLRRTDKFSASRIEAFSAGLDVAVSCVFHEWKATELKLLTYVNDTITPSGTQVLNIGLVGLERTQNSAVIVLTSTPNTPARANSFTTITLHAVTPDEGFSLDLQFGPDKLVLPFRGAVWPVDDGSGGAKFLTTS